MRQAHQNFAVALLLATAVTLCGSQTQPPAGNAANDPDSQATRLLELTNQARGQQGAVPLKWDSALAAAALAHCQRMVAAGELSHRFDGEADTPERVSQAGAHFNLIEENVAQGPDMDTVHTTWMNSSTHRTNLLNKDVDHAGIAVLPGPGGFFVVADYARTVAALSREQVESAVAALVRSSGLRIRTDPTAARVACPTESDASSMSPPPSLVVRWQSADLTTLPTQIAQQLKSGRYSEAEVGSCAPLNATASFAMHRVALLLY